MVSFNENKTFKFELIQCLTIHLANECQGNLEGFVCCLVAYFDISFLKRATKYPHYFGGEINTEDINRTSYTTQSLNGLNRLC